MIIAHDAKQRKQGLDNETGESGLEEPVGESHPNMTLNEEWVTIPDHRDRGDPCWIPSRSPQSSEGGTLEVMNENIRDTRRSGLRTFILIMLIPIFLGIGLGAQQIALSDIRDIRKLERIPLSPIRAVMPGPVRLAGAAEAKPDVPLQASNWTESPCMWFRAIKEREERDSDGNRSWRTVSDVTRGTAFQLKDATGRIDVELDERIDFVLNMKYRKVKGDYRYTEYRIDPGDSIRIVGMVGMTNAGPEVLFPNHGEYVPIITDQPVTGVRAWRSLISTLVIILSVFAIAAATTCLMLGIRRLNTLAFAIVLGTVQTGILLAGGLMMMSEDLQAAQNSLTQQQAEATTIVKKDFSRLGVDWNGDWSNRKVFEQATKSPAPGPQLAEIRDSLGARADRTREIRSRFPQSLVAWAMGLAPTPRIFTAGEKPPDGVAAIESAVPSWWGPALIVLVAMTIGLLGLKLGFKKVKLKRLIENIPTLPAAEVDIGINELQGTAQACEDIKPLNGPLTDKPCFWYRYQIQEWRGLGKNRHLHTILDRKNHQLLLCTDDSGSIPISLVGARIITGRSAVQKKGRRVYTEHSIRPDDPLYVLGSAEIDPNTGDSLRIEKDPQGLPYLVSNLPEDRLKTKQITTAFWMLAFGIASVAAVILGLLLFTGRIAAVDQLLAAASAIGAVALLVIAIMYNDLVFLRQRVLWSKANIDVALKKRADLLPQLVEIARGYNAYESEVLPLMAGLRKAWGDYGSSEKQTATSVEMSQKSTSGLLALREKYPQLKANTTTDRLMMGIVRLENEISARRDGYNAAVERYRSRIHAIPEIILARSFRFRDMPLLQWDASIRIMEHLDFDTPPRPPEEHQKEEITHQDADAEMEVIEDDEKTGDHE